MTDDLVQRLSGPLVDEDSAPYWQGLREHRLLLQRCSDCGETRFPPMPGCPNCGSSESEELEVVAGGTVYSWISVHRAITEATEPELPYHIAVVELAPGCRTVGRYRGGRPEIGIPVEFAFVDHEGWTELVFGPKA